MMILGVAGWKVANVDFFAFIILAALILLHCLLNLLLLFGCEFRLLVEDINDKYLGW